MEQQRLLEIRELFPCKTETSFRNVEALVKDSVHRMGTDETIEMIGQWKILAQKLNNRSKLTCLGDKNHRLMLLEYLKEGAASEYKSSYFNRAKISPEYIDYLQKMGPFVFAEVITIVNKLKLIRKHALNLMGESYNENHILMKVKEILGGCGSRKRSENSNMGKFMRIVGFEEREELVKELGKMLRMAWAKEKEKGGEEKEEREEVMQPEEVKVRKGS